MNRRSMFGTLAAVAVLPAMAPVIAAAPANPDAALIRLAHAHERLRHKYNNDFPNVDSDDHPLALAAQARRNGNAERRQSLLNQMMHTPPVTLAGLQAVAAALVVEDTELLRPCGWGDDGDRLTALLVRSLLSLQSEA